MQGVRAEGGGAWAEFVVADASIVGLMPKSLNFSEAGVLPMVALTGYEAFRFAQVRAPVRARACARLGVLAHASA